jgi:hypothetical protein
MPRKPSGAASTSTGRAGRQPFRTTYGSRSHSLTNVDSIVTHHRNGFRSGVARFNELLAERLGVPLRGLDEEAAGFERSLLSFKASEMSEEERGSFARRLAAADWHGEAYLHEYAGLDLEREIVRRARRVHCGNLEIYEHVRELNPESAPVWTPGLLVDRRDYEPADLTVFSFGMAHKIQTERFRRLRELLDATGRSYAVYVSAANHETSSLEDAEAVFREMHEVFPDLYFLGNLSDVAVHNQLRQATYFAAFFPGGVRANNTTVAAAMETGAVVITNLDRHSPPEYVHMENLIDIEQCAELPADPAALGGIRAAAVETASTRGWDELVKRL